MVSRNLERANENDGFKMTALEYSVNVRCAAEHTMSCPNVSLVQCTQWNYLFCPHKQSKQSVD